MSPIQTNGQPNKSPEIDSSSGKSGKKLCLVAQRFWGKLGSTRNFGTYYLCERMSLISRSFDFRDDEELMSLRSQQFCIDFYSGNTYTLCRIKINCNLLMF